MSKLAQILLAVVSLSAIFSWAAIAYLWSDQQRLLAAVNELQQVDGRVVSEETNELVDQALISISGIDKRVERLELATQSAVTKQAANVTAPISNKSGVNEYFVPLGFGQTSQTEWIDLNGTAVFVSPNNYQNIKEVLFEGGMSIVGGEVYARVKNKTTGAVIDISQISNNTQASKTVVSAPFQLHPGNNEYIVQIRTSSGETGSIEGARIRIVIK